MDAAFIRGFQTETNRQPFVFRHQLVPLTLGHLFLLESIGSPLIGSNNDPVTIADIGIAVFSCSHSHDVSLRKMRSWSFPIYVRVWSWFARADWLLSDLQIFRDYLTDELQSPRIRPVQRDGGRVCNAPGPWLKLFFAMHVLGLSRDDAMRSTVVELNALYATWAEWNGAGEIVEGSQFSALMEFAKVQDSLRFNPDGTRKTQEAG